MNDARRYRLPRIDAQNARCFHIMEPVDAERLNAWTSCWDDLIDFEITPILSSQEYWFQFE
ncbi:DUF3303 domain-containing protein [Silvibacterium bohemicum]|uniref:DUF3303 domain-containing protein n=1 Tax=Silvibacterium bohemicum TaxID=1577686 RepID=UPI0035D50118